MICHVSIKHISSTRIFSQCLKFFTVAMILVAGSGHCFLSVAHSQTTSSADPTAAPSEEKHAPSESWPLFRGNPASTGVATSDLPDELQILWEFKVPNGAFEGSTAIVPDPDDPAKKTIYIGDLDGKLFAIDLESGEKRWEFATDIGFVTAPAVKDGKIFIGDLDGQFYCLDQTGKKIWSFQTDGEINSSANFFGDNVLVGSQDSHLYSFNAESGELVWKYQSQDQIRCSATVAGDRAFVAGCDGFFHIVDLNTGMEVGNTDIASPTGSTPAAMGDLVFFGNEQGNFFAVNWKEVRNQWVVTPQEAGNSFRGCAALNDQHVVIGGRNRQVYSLDPETGKQNWAVKLKAKIDSSPVIVGDRVFVASTDGRMFALALKDGGILWEKQFNGGFISSPAVAYGRLVIATDRGVVYCLGSKK